MKSSLFKRAFAPSNSETGNILEGGKNLKDVAEAHAAVEDNTGIKRPETTLPEKFAGDETEDEASEQAKSAAAQITPSKAITLCEDTCEDLKNLFLKAKPLTGLNSTRAVREAVDLIYNASVAFGEIEKLFIKQKDAEEAEEKAAEEKTKRKSSAMDYSKEPNAAEATNRNCKACGKKFYTKSGKDQQYCSATCDPAHKRKSSASEKPVPSAATQAEIDQRLRSDYDSYPEGEDEEEPLDEQPEDREHKFGGLYVPKKAEGHLPPSMFEDKDKPHTFEGIGNKCKRCGKGYAEHALKKASFGGLYVPKKAAEVKQEAPAPKFGGLYVPGKAKTGATKQDRVAFVTALTEHSPAAQQGTLSPHVVEVIADDLMRLGSPYKRLQTTFTSEPIGDVERTKQEEKEHAIEEKARAYAAQLGVTAMFEGDPRGFTMFIAFPDGYATVQGRGVPVPTS